MYLNLPTVFTCDRIYYLKTKEVLDPVLEEKSNKLILELFHEIMTIDECERSVLFGDENTVFLILDQYRTEKITDLLDSLTIEYTITDITDDVLMGLYIDDNFENTINDTLYTGVITDFINAHLDINKVLDKINLCGLESLNIHDHRVLQSI